MRQTGDRPDGQGGIARVLGTHPRVNLLTVTDHAEDPDSELHKFLRIHLDIPLSPDLWDDVDSALENKELELAKSLVLESVRARGQGSEYSRSENVITAALSQ